MTGKGIEMIHSELYQRLKFGHSDNRYMYKPESVQENDTHKILWDIKIQTDHQIPTKNKEFVILWILPFQQTIE